MNRGKVITPYIVDLSDSVNRPCPDLYQEYEGPVDRERKPK